MKTILLSLFVLGTQVLSAQFFVEATDTNLEGVFISAADFADIDGDNDLDVIISGFDETDSPVSILYSNDGEGHFTEVVNTPFEGLSLGDVMFVDIDGDNDPDIFMTGYILNSSTSKLYANDGLGNYTEVADTPFEHISNSAAAFADIDGDNDPDLLISGENGADQKISKLYVNEGGTFTEVTDTPFFGATEGSISFADIDGNSYPDVIVTGKTGFSGSTQLYTNDAGIFTEANTAGLEQVTRSCTAFADVDGDGDPDLFITGMNNSLVQVAKLYINQNGTFTESVGSTFEGVEYGSISIADVDGDNDPDVVITGSNNLQAATSTLYINDGLGNFAEFPDTPFSGVKWGSADFADVDGDNDADILLTGSGLQGGENAKLYFNTGPTSVKNPLGNLNFEFIIFPNPSLTENIQVSYISETKSPLVVNVYNMQGQLMLQQNEQSTGATLTIDISKLSQGSYMLQLMDGERTGSRLFIVE